MRLLENLRKVKDILSDESKWTQKAYARDNMGLFTSVFGDDACCWCLMGAIYKVIGNETAEENAIYKVIGNETAEENEIVGCLKDFVDGSVAVYNDDKNTTYEDIVELLDNGIESVNV